MNELVLVAGIFALAFVSAFVPVVSIELALVAAAATGSSGRQLAAQVLVAAAGQMLGKSCFFVGGRSAFTRLPRRGKPRDSRRGRLTRLIARATRRRAGAAVTVFVSAVTGLPPFGVVSALAGACRLRLSSFMVLGLVGRCARFAGVVLVPQVVGL